MPDREKVIMAMECCAVGAECDHCPYSRLNDGGYQGCYQMHQDAFALLKEYDEALKLMVYQYCTMKPLTVHDEVFHNKYMSAGEAAFRLLGLENGQSTDGVWERWFPNG